MSPEIRQLVAELRVDELEQSLTSNQLIQLISLLRRSRQLENSLEVASRLSHSLLIREPNNNVIITVRAAVLKDIGELQSAANLLIRNLDFESNSYSLRVAASVLWHGNQRRNAVHVFQIADSICPRLGNRQRLSADEIRQIRVALQDVGIRERIPCQSQFETRVIVDQFIMRLNLPVAVSGLNGFTIRPLKSKRQLARVANQLRNCLNSYLERIVNSATLLFAVEKFGVPLEAFEVNPTNGILIQWKGIGNAPANPATRKVIESFLRDPGPEVCAGRANTGAVRNCALSDG